VTLSFDRNGIDLAVRPGLLGTRVWADKDHRVAATGRVCRGRESPKKLTAKPAVALAAAAGKRSFAGLPIQRVAVIIDVSAGKRTRQSVQTTEEISDAVQFQQ